MRRYFGHLSRDWAARGSARQDSLCGWSEYLRFVSLIPPARSLYSATLQATLTNDYIYRIKKKTS